MPLGAMRASSARARPKKVTTGPWGLEGVAVRVAVAVATGVGEEERVGVSVGVPVRVGVGVRVRVGEIVAVVVG
jgi:hypothetical protein